MKRDFVALALVFGAIALFGQSMFWQGAVPFRGDIPLQFYPWKCYTRAILASGEIPYWNPYTFGGAPFLANMQSAVFYPLDLLLFLFPMEWFYGLSLLLHLALAGCGAYLLARICGASPFPSAIAGIAYGLNGFTMIHIPAGNHLTYAGAAWVPWMLWATAGFVLTRHSRLPWALAGTFIACLHFLCGHPQMTFYSLVFSFLFCLFLGIGSERFKDRPNYPASIVRIAVWSAFLLFGIAMAGMQLIPTLQYFGEANRAASLDLSMATEFSFAPHRIVTLFAPDYYGTMIRGTHYDSFVFWSCAYAGFWVPLAALAALFRTGRRYPVVIPLALTAFLGLLFAWGRGNPVYALLFQLPGFGNFRAPAKYLPYYLAPVCVLASLGVEYWGNRAFERIQQYSQAAKTIRYVFVLALSAVLLAMLAFIGIPILAGLSSDGTIRLTNDLFGVDLQKRLSEPGMTDIGRVMTLERLASLYRMVFLFLACIPAYAIARLTPRAPRLLLSLALGIILFADLYYYGRNYLLASLVRVETVRSSVLPSSEIGFLRPDRISLQPDRLMNRKDLDIPNLFMHWRVYNIAGYDPMSLRTYNRQIGLMENWKEGEYHDNIQLSAIDHPVLDRLNVRYIATRETLNEPSLIVRHEGNDFRVYERMGSSRAWAMTRPPGAKEDSSEWQPAGQTIELLTYSPHEIVFACSFQDVVDMRVAEWDYPGWRAEAVFQDGSRKFISIQPSTEGLRSFTLPLGAKQIHLYYSAPWSGWLLTGLSDVIFIMLVLFAAISRTDRFLFFTQRLMGRDF